MIEKIIKFPFKGGRNYIHGTQLFDAVVREFEGKTITDIRFTIHSYIHTPGCSLYISEIGTDESHPESAAMICYLNVDGNAMRVSAESNAAADTLVQRIEYDEESVLKHCALRNDEIKLLADSPYTFIETVVTMNKKLNQTLFPDAESSGVWAFTRLDLPALITDTQGVALKFQHNFNLKLTKSAIYFGDRKFGDIYFSLVA